MSKSRKAKKGNSVKDGDLPSTASNELDPLNDPQLDNAQEPSTEDLVRELQERGLSLNEEQFRVEVEGCKSAEALYKKLDEEGRIKLPPGVSEESVWVLIICLWERWLPDCPCLETLMDRIEEHYELMARDEAAACESGLALWKLMRNSFRRSHARSLCEFDQDYFGTYSIIDWAFELQTALDNSTRIDLKYAHWLIEFSDQVIEAIPDDIDFQRLFLRSKAEAFVALGDFAAGEKLISDEVGNDPSWGWGWIAWADLYLWAPKGHRDLKKAEMLLRDALELPGVENRSDIVDRLCFILSEAGRKKEAAALLKAQQSRFTRTVQETPGGLRIKETITFSGGGIPLSELGNLQARAKAELSGSGPSMDSDDVDFREPADIAGIRVGRNDPCPCGSGKKYKKCCGE